jgi:hypothetical protein
MRLLVAGGRNYSNYELLERVLDILRPSWIIAGGAKGADTLAVLYAQANDIPYHEYFVDYALDGPWPGAGPRRNARMLRLSRPDMGLLFPGGNGTADMRRKLIAAKIPTLEVHDPKI